MEIQPPDSFHLSAAQGWAELGNPVEASTELAKLPATLQDHPDVVAVRWSISAAANNWNAALAAAEQLIQLQPHEALGWIHQSYALHELKRTAEARDHLLKIVDKFPDGATMRYNIACYECQLGRLAEARQWLAKAFRLGDKQKMRAMALEDLDLQPLWKELRESRTDS